ncbi:MAG: chromate efflux transporter [Bdellovibrionales bacterium]
MNPIFQLKDLLLYFLKLGAVRFGGPAALVQTMRQDLIFEKKWFSERDYQVGLALAQMAPGPLASQLAIYFGWKKSGFWGGFFVLIAFALPAFLLVCLLAHFYSLYQDFSWLKAVTIGASGCVMALMMKSAIQLAKGVPLKDPIYLFILCASALATVIFKSELGWIFIISGVIAWAHQHYKKQKGLKSLILFFFSISFLHSTTSEAQNFWDAIRESMDWKLFQYFFEVGALVFGSGSVIIPFLYTGVVHEFHWLSEMQFLDAMMVGMLTPGPMVITVAFVGYLVEGFSGAFLSCLGIFLPCFLFVVFPAPFFEKMSEHNDLSAALEGMSVAATGAILGAVWMVAQKTFQHPVTVAVFIICALILWKGKKVPDPLLILGSALTGWIFIS